MGKDEGKRRTMKDGQKVCSHEGSKEIFQCVQIQCRPKNDTSCDGDQKRDNHRVLYHGVEEIN